jgi:hypothetical protein
VNIYLFILGALGVWRITHLLHAEDGPGEIVIKLRKLAADGVVGQAMDCFYCLSMWIAMPFALLVGQSWLERALLWPALSGAAIAVELLMARLRPTPPAVAVYAEDAAQASVEESDVQLWEFTTKHEDDRDDANRNVARGKPCSSAIHDRACASGSDV